MAVEGNQALALFEKSKPDVCILDIMLPQKDGLSIAREIRQADSHVPILFVTAKTQTEDVIAGFETGGNDYIRKPFSMEELIVRVNNLISITQPRKGNARESVTFGHWAVRIPRFAL
jgi:DNA-binding response OmpR family regulator